MKDLLRDMLGRASELLSEGKTITEWFNPKDCLHRGAYRIYCQTGSWPEGVVPENVTLTSGWEDQLTQKLTAEGKVPDKDDSDAKIIQKLTEAGIKENEVRDIWVWVVTQPTKQSTLNDVVFKTTPKKLLVQGAGGLKPEDVIGIYDNEVEARKKGVEILRREKSGIGEGKINETGWFDRAVSELKADPKFQDRLKKFGPDSENVMQYVVNYLGVGTDRRIVNDIVRAATNRPVESKVNEGPLDTEKPEAEAGAGFKDPGFKGKKEPVPGEKEEEAPVGDLDVDDEHEAVEADFDKIYLGQDDTNHYYVIAKKDEEGSTEDLLVTDQEGKELFSAKENDIDFHDVGKFILAAINSDKVKIREIEREVVIQYLVPEKEEELGAGEEEEEEGEGPEGEEAPSKGENEEPEIKNPDQERPMESRKVVTEKKVIETVTMKDGKGNTFSLQIVDEGGKDVVVQINNREFRFKPDFVALYEMDGGKLTEKGLQDMATELISHLREDEYAEVVGSGVQETKHIPRPDPNAREEVEIFRDVLGKGKEIWTSVYPNGVKKRFPSKKSAIEDSENRGFAYTIDSGLEKDVAVIFHSKDDNLWGIVFPDGTDKAFSTKEEAYAAAKEAGLRIDSGSVEEDLDPSVTKQAGEDTLLQRAQQLRAKKDRTPDDDTTLQQLENEIKTRGQKEQVKEDVDSHIQSIMSEFQKMRNHWNVEDAIVRVAKKLGLSEDSVAKIVNRFIAVEGKVPDKDDGDSKIVKKLTEEEKQEFKPYTDWNPEEPDKEELPSLEEVFKDKLEKITDLSGGEEEGNWFYAMGTGGYRGFSEKILFQGRISEKQAIKAALGVLKAGGSYEGSRDDPNDWILIGDGWAAQRYKNAIVSGGEHLSFVASTDENLIESLWNSGEDLHDFFNKMTSEDELEKQWSQSSPKNIPNESKIKEQYLDESEEFQSCASHGGRVRTVSGPNKEHGLKAGEYIHYCYLRDKSFRGEVKTKENESKIEEEEKDGLAKKAGKKPGDFDKGQLEAGTKVEMEHTDNPSKARQIAMDHLTEDPHYYTKLKKMENEGKMNEREFSDMAAEETKNVFKVDFILDSGEKKSTWVMAVDKFEAEWMLKRQKGVKSISSVTLVTSENESKVSEDKVTEDSASGAEYHKKLFDFLDHPWQEDSEIELVTLIREYQDQFKVIPPAPIQAYLKRLVEANQIMGRRGFSDAFINELQDLMGAGPSNSAAKEGEPPVESKKSGDGMKKESKIKESIDFTPGGILLAVCTQEHGWSVAQQLESMMDGDLEDLNPNAVQLIRELLQKAKREGEGELQIYARDLLGQLPGEESGKSEEEEEVSEPEMEESVNTARRLLGLKEKDKEDEPIKVGNTIQIVDARNYRVEIEEAVVHAIDEKQGVEITGSKIPVSQKWYGSKYWLVSKL